MDNLKVSIEAKDAPMNALPFTAAMLNPEAGNHPVPDNDAELQAALRSAERCMEEYPYFDERYGERGRAFAKSDAAWLATLPSLTRTQLISQVEWLGRVLGNRGMPRITLERQLDLLHHELVAAVPEKSEAYGGLREAAESLRRERLGLIPLSPFGELARAFHAAADPERHEKLRGTGSLLVSAVCDEACGITEAVGSLISWLADPGRFSGLWIAEVNRTVEAARKLAGRLKDTTIMNGNRS